MEMWRLSEFELERIESNERLLVIEAESLEPQDERVFILGEDAPVEVLDTGHSSLMAFDTPSRGIRTLRQIQSTRDARLRYHWNRMIFTSDQESSSPETVRSTGARLAPTPAVSAGRWSCGPGWSTRGQFHPHRSGDALLQSHRPQDQGALRAAQSAPHPGRDSHELKVQRAHRRGVTLRGHPHADLTATGDHRRGQPSPPAASRSLTSARGSWPRSTAPW